MSEVYGLNIPKENVVPMDTGLGYEALDKGQVDVAMLYTTGGLIQKFKLHVLDDDKSFFSDL